MLGGEVDGGGDQCVAYSASGTVSYSVKNDVRNIDLISNYASDVGQFGGQVEQFGGEIEPSGGEASPVPPPLLDETLMGHNYYY